jgi:hypothetical protein
MTRTAMSNPAESVLQEIQVSITADRRRLDCVVAHLPIRILSEGGGNPMFYPAICTNLSRSGIGFETTSRLEVGRVIEFEFVQVVDEAVRYWVRILLRDNCRYEGYYVNDDGTDIRPTD